MYKCQQCQEYIFNSANTCRCEEFAIIDEDGELHKLFAIDEEDAAMKYAEKANTEGDYYLMNESAEITVNGKKFLISAEPDVHYSANAI